MLYAMEHLGVANMSDEWKCIYVCFSVLKPWNGLVLDEYLILSMIVSSFFYKNISKLEFFWFWLFEKSHNERTHYFKNLKELMGF